MVPDKAVEEMIASVVDEVNEVLPAEQRLSKSPDTALFGESSALDSLGMVNFIVAVEQRIENQFGISVTLLDDALSSPEVPFATIGKLTRHVTSLLEKSNS